jgi:hypothetical protein
LSLPACGGLLPVPCQHYPPDFLLTLSHSCHTCLPACLPALARLDRPAHRDPSAGLLLNASELGFWEGSIEVPLGTQAEAKVSSLGRLV